MRNQSEIKVTERYETRVNRYETRVNRYETRLTDMRLGLTDMRLDLPCNHDGREGLDPFLFLYQTFVECSILHVSYHHLSVRVIILSSIHDCKRRKTFVEDSSVDGSRKQIVRGGDCVNVACERKTQTLLFQRCHNENVRVLLTSQCIGRQDGMCKVSDQPVRCKLNSSIGMT